MAGRQVDFTRKCVAKEGDYMNWFHPQSPFFRGVGKVFEVILVSILWFLTSLPIVTVGASTTALYYVCTKVIRHNQGYLFKEYFTCFKNNFHQAVFPWIIQCFIAAMLMFNIRLCQLTQTPWLKYLETPMWILLLLLFCFSVHYYALLAHFNNTTVHLLKYSVVIPVIQLPATLLNSIIVIMVLTVFYLLPQLSWLAPGIIGLILSVRLEKIFQFYEQQTS
jgi:uncharacterized membrane protein YesL